MNLQDERFSCVKQIKKTIHVAVPSLYVTNEIVGVTEILESWKRQYIPQLQGVVVDYKNVSVTLNAGHVMTDKPFVHYDVNATFSLFCPSVGSLAKGVINRISKEHIGCLILNTINVTIRRYDEQISKFLSMDREIIFQISHFDFHRKLIRVTGKITPECINLMETLYPESDVNCENQPNDFNTNSVSRGSVKHVNTHNFYSFSPDGSSDDSHKRIVSEETNSVSSNLLKDIKEEPNKESEMSEVSEKGNKSKKRKKRTFSELQNSESDSDHRKKKKKKQKVSSNFAPSDLNSENNILQTLIKEEHNSSDEATKNINSTVKQKRNKKSSLKNEIAIADDCLEKNKKTELSLQHLSSFNGTEKSPKHKKNYNSLEDTRSESLLTVNSVQKKKHKEKKVHTNKSDSLSSSSLDVNEVADIKDEFMPFNFSTPHILKQRTLKSFHLPEISNNDVADENVVKNSVVDTFPMQENESLKKKKRNKTDKKLNEHKKSTLSEKKIKTGKSKKNAEKKLKTGKKKSKHENKSNSSEIKKKKKNKHSKDKKSKKSSKKKRLDEIA